MAGEALSPADVRDIEQDCERLIRLFSHHNDDNDAAAIVALFAPDGSFARPSDPDNPVRGTEALLSFFRDRPRRATRHLLTNIVVDVESATRARARSYIVLYLGADGPEPAKIQSVAVGDFHDRLVRIGDRWLFQERKGSMKFVS